jgi:hypothetical protein
MTDRIRPLVSQNVKRRPGSALDDRATNALLDLIRDGWDSGDPWGSALIAMGNLIDYTPGDVVDRKAAEEGVIDSMQAWLADLWEGLVEHDYAEGLDDEAENLARAREVWDEWETHAHAVLDRLANLARIAGRDY